MSIQRVFAYNLHIINGKVLSSLQNLLKAFPRIVTLVQVVLNVVHNQTDTRVKKKLVKAFYSSNTLRGLQKNVDVILSS